MKIEGKRVIIKQTEKKDLDSLMELWNNGEVMKWVNFPNGLNMTKEKMEIWFEKISNNNNRHHFVVLTKDFEFCGEVYYGIDEIHHRADLDIKFLPRFQGKGLANDAFKLLIDLVFTTELTIDALYTEPNIGNNASMKLYKKNGLIPKERPKDLEPHDTYYEITRKDWKILKNN